MPTPRSNKLTALVAEHEELIKSAVVDRRQALRFSCILKASRVGGASVSIKPPWLARVMNISTGGLGLHLGEPFEIGTVLTLRLHTTSGTSLTPVEVRVVHVAKQPNGTWTLGVAFNKPMGDADLEQLLA